MQYLVLALTLLQPGPQIQFHHIDAARKDNCCQDCVSILVEGGILKVVVIERDKNGEREEEEGQIEREEAGAGV